MPNVLNAAQTAEFNEKGFTYARGLFAPDEINLLTRAMQEDPAVRSSILDRAQRAAVLDLRVLQCLGDGEIGRAGHAVLLQGGNAFRDAQRL